MKRRQVILGLGAIATGGSALIGSGAFSSVEAERDISVEVAGDDSAYLRLGPCTDEDGNEKPNGAYTVQDDGLFGIALTEENDNVDGDGVNPEARSTFHNVFEMCNQGTQEVCINFGIEGEVPKIKGPVPDRFDFSEDDDAIVFYEEDDPDAVVDITDRSVDTPAAFELDTGECQCIGLEVRSFGYEAGEEIFEDADFRFVAEADAACSDAIGDCRIFEAEHKCSLGELATNATVREVFGQQDGEVTAAVLNAPDKDSVTKELTPDGEDTIKIEASTPLAGLIWWDSPDDCEGLNLTKVEEWDGFETATDITPQQLFDNTDEYDAVYEEDEEGDQKSAERRLNEIEAIDGIEDFEEDHDDLEQGEVPRQWFIAEIDYSEFDVDNRIQCELE